jgi:hypothetical protein
MELIQGIIESKSVIAEALMARGVEVGDAKLEELATMVSNLEVGFWSEDFIRALISGSFVKLPQEATLKLPGGLTKIKNYCFSENLNVDNVVVPEGVTEIGQNCFYYCRCSSITLPKSLKLLSNTALYACSRLTELIIPDGVNNLTINTGALQLMNSLKKVHFGEGTKSIGTYVMTNTTNVEEMYVASTITSIGTVGIGTKEGASVTFAGRTMAEVQAMTGYPWQIRTGSTIHCTDGDIVRT